MKLKRRRGDDRGSVALEFALIVPVFLLLVYGGISFGLAMSTKAQMTEAAAEGARYAIANTNGATDPCATSATQGYAYNAKAQAANALKAMGYNAQWATITATPSVSTCIPTSTAVSVTVTITYPYKDHPIVPGAPGLGLVLPATLNSTYVVEVQ